MTKALLDIAGNPMPDHAISGYFSARDGKQLRFARFAATARPLVGTVIIFGGRNEPVEKYFETIVDLQERGFGVALFDWRGQGGSDRLLRNSMLGHIDSFQTYVADMNRFLTEIVLPDCRAPFYALAHSTGALIALAGAPTFTNRIRRMVLCAPLLSVGGTDVSLKNVRRIAVVLRYTGFSRFPMRGGRTPRTNMRFEENAVTSDRARFERNRAILGANPMMSLAGPTVSWVHAASVAAEKVQDVSGANALQIPTLIVAAGADSIVSNRSIESYTRHQRLVSMITIDGARHEILQEADRYRDQFWAAFDAFIPGSDSDEIEFTD